MIRRISLALLCLLAVGCATGSTAAPALTPAEAESATGSTLYISSEGSVFDRDVMTVPADTPFVIRYENHDRVPHNVAIREGSTALVGEVFSGPGERVYQFPPLDAGSYRFLCDVHPEMAGRLEVTER